MNNSEQETAVSGGLQKQYANTVVLKLGGSIFTDAEAYRKAASFILDRLRSGGDERYLVVVSAQDGTTDSDEQIARGIRASPDPRILDLLWATGELRSVALLSMHLHAMEIKAVGLNVHETGLWVPTSANGSVPIELVSIQIHKELSQNSVVVVPGFLATNRSGSIVSLGRGGSDLTAVLLAQNLHALRCELVKDVPGYFTADPNVDKTSQHIPVLSYEQALAIADAGSNLVQRQAIAVASEFNIPLVIRSMSESAPASLISQDR